MNCTLQENQAIIKPAWVRISGDMDIYNARKIQKELFKAAKKDFRMMRAYMHKGELYYQVIQKIYDEYYVVFRDDAGTKQNLERIQKNIKCGMIITFQYLTEENGLGGPSGMYVLEAIPVD